MDFRKIPVNPAPGKRQPRPGLLWRDPDPGLPFRFRGCAADQGLMRPMSIFGAP
jgi:hypothetical protein